MFHPAVGSPRVSPVVATIEKMMELASRRRRLAAFAIGRMFHVEQAATVRLRKVVLTSQVARRRVGAIFFASARCLWLTSHAKGVTRRAGNLRNSTLATGSCRRHYQLMHCQLPRGANVRRRKTGKLYWARVSAERQLALLFLLAAKAAKKSLGHREFGLHRRSVLHNANISSEGASACVSLPIKRDSAQSRVPQQCAKLANGDRHNRISETRRHECRPRRQRSKHEGRRSTREALSADCDPRMRSCYRACADVLSNPAAAWNRSC